MNDKIKIALYILILAITFCIVVGIQYPMGLLIYNLIFQCSPKSVSATFFAGSIFEISIFIVAGITVILFRKFDMIGELPDFESDVQKNIFCPLKI